MADFIVYRIYASDKNLLYVGASKRIRRRISEHGRSPFGHKIKSVRIQRCKSFQEMRWVEANAIFKEQPKFNQILNGFYACHCVSELGIENHLSFGHPDFRKIFKEWVAKNRKDGRKASEPYPSPRMRRSLRKQGEQ